MTKYFCSLCYVELAYDEDVSCTECQEDINKRYPPPKRKEKNDKFYGPDDDEEWEDVPSPFKPYKEGV